MIKIVLSKLNVRGDEQSKVLLMLSTGFLVGLLHHSGLPWDPSSLAKALASHPKVFDTIFVNMVEAGESSGTLSLVLLRLADLKEAQYLGLALGELKGRITWDDGKDRLVFSKVDLKKKTLVSRYTVKYFLKQVIYLYN